jgi:hypothetical protein
MAAKTRVFLTVDDVEQLRDEVLQVASELTKGAQLLAASGKKGVALYGVVEARKGLQNARNVAATVIGQASVGESLVDTPKETITAQVKRASAAMIAAESKASYKKKKD